MTKIAKPCVVCGKNILIYPSQSKLIKCCSKVCSTILKKSVRGEQHPNWKGRLLKVCPTCKKSFVVATYYKNQIYCSHECRLAQHRVLKICHNCNKTYREQAYKQSKFCSRNCVGEYQRKEHPASETEFKKGMIPHNKGKPGISGPEHPRWRGGVSYLPYCYKFNEKLKEAVRNRDNRTCQFCNIKENGKKHPVHHIHYDKQNCHPDLITLCISCNSKVNSNRNYYENLFMNKLNDKGLLFWTKGNLEANQLPDTR